jgi:hypothetical protein
MKIKLEIEMPIEIVGDDVIIKSHDALNKLFGSSATASSLHIFGIEKLPQNTWKVPLSKLKERYKDLLQKVDDMQQKTIIIKQILDSITENHKSESKIVLPKKVRGPYKKHHRTANEWTRDELNIIKNNLDTKTKKLIKYLPGRTKKAITLAKWKMKAALKLAHKSIHNKKKPYVKPTIKNVKIFDNWSDAEDTILKNNIDKQPKYLMTLLPKRTIPAIYVRKCQLRKKMGKPVMVTVHLSEDNLPQFPSFSMIPKTKFILETTRHNLIGKGKLEYRDVNWIAATEEWNEDLWNTFITEFMLNSKKIAEYFGIDNRFAVDNDGTMKKLIVRGI